MTMIYARKQKADFDGFIPRIELTANLLRQAKSGLTVLSAPGGYGKSWLAHQVALSMPAREHCLWTVQSTDTLMQALRSFCALFEQSAVPALDPESVADIAITAMSNGDARTKLLIIDLDGAPPSKPVQTLVAQILLKQLSQGSALVACRNPWLLPIDRLATRASLKVLKAPELALTAAELSTLSDVPEHIARTWLQLTEGWPALCTDPEQWQSFMTPSTDGDALIDRVVNGSSEYMEHVLLGAMPAKDVRLLMQVSIFKTIEPGMLEAMDIGGGAWTRLSTLVDTGVPLSSPRADWDRIAIHPVFRRFLERRLAAHTPALYQSLHRQASEYFVALGQYGYALRHAARTNDAAFEAQITEQCGGWRISWREGLRALNPGQQINSTPQQLLERFPKAALARIYWYLQTGRIDEGSHALERLRTHSASSELANDLQVISSIVAIYRDELFDEQRIQSLAKLRAAHQDEEPLLIPGGATIQAAAYINSGLYDRATTTARRVIADTESLGSSHYIEYYGHLHYAAALHGLGRVVEATPEYLHALTLAEVVFGLNSSEHRMSTLMAAHASWLAGDDEQADRLADNVEGLWRLHAWFEVYARVLQVAVSISRARGDRALAERVLEDFSLVAERRNLPRLQIVVQLIRAQQALADGQIDTAEQGCDAALQAAVALFPTRSSAAAGLLVPLWVEKARIALLRGAFDLATQALERIREWMELLQDGSLRLEAQLIEVYIALRARRYRDVLQLLTQCVQEAERTGLQRPFRNNAAFLLELAEYARTHALGIDTGVLRRAVTMARADAAEHATTPERGSMAASGHLLLTDRETDILHLLAEGLSSKEMARRLAIAEGTVKTHRRHLYEKLESGRRTHAIARARELGLL